MCKNWLYKVCTAGNGLKIAYLVCVQTLGATTHQIAMPFIVNMHISSFLSGCVLCTA